MILRKGVASAKVKKKKRPQARERHKNLRSAEVLQLLQRVIVFTKGLNNTTDDEMGKALEL